MMRSERGGEKRDVSMIIKEKGKGQWMGLEEP